MCYCRPMRQFFQRNIQPLALKIAPCSFKSETKRSLITSKKKKILQIHKYLIGKYITRVYNDSRYSIKWVNLYFLYPGSTLQVRKDTAGVGREPGWRWRVCCINLCRRLWLAVVDPQCYTEWVPCVDWMRGTCNAPGSGTWWKYNTYK